MLSTFKILGGLSLVAVVSALWSPAVPAPASSASFGAPAALLDDPNCMCPADGTVDSSDCDQGEGNAPPTMQFTEGPTVTPIQDGRCNIGNECPDDPRVCMWRVSGTFTSSKLDCNKPNCSMARTAVEYTYNEEEAGDPCAQGGPTEASWIVFTSCDSLTTADFGVFQQCTTDGTTRWHFIDGCSIHVKCNKCPAEPE